jgi:WD40 repeat protein
LNTTRINPFPGLRPFLSHEKHLFFGRERQVAELVERLSSSRFLAVVGTSGSGKSSLVRAGLLPELHGGNLVSAGSRWEVIVMRPGGGPMQNLASAFLEADLYEAAGPDRIAPLVTTLNHSRFGLIEAVRQSDLPKGTNLLIIVDQFEELFRFHNQLASGDEHATDFVNLLLEATRQEAVPIYVALTMRSDFLGDCSQFAGLAEAVNKGEYLIPRMNRDQCRLAIEGPVRVGGARIAPRLTQRLLNEIGDNPDQLPVLQHALMRTWDRWFARHAGLEPGPSAAPPIDLEDYEATGTMAEALSRHADEVFEGLADDPQPKLAERLFKALTERGTDGRGVRRPVRIERLAEILDAPTAEILPVIEAFRAPGRTFLMPMQPASLLPATVIDISHESLMRVWQRLRRWVEEEAQSARIYRRLAETAALQAQGHASLYRDPDLQIALAWRDQQLPTAAWADRYHTGFSASLAFLNASSEASHAEEAAKEAARQRELNQAKALADAERRRAEDEALHAERLRWLVRGLGLALLLAIIATFFAIRARNSARESEGRARAATLRAQKLQLEASRQAYASTINLAQSLLDSGRSSDAEQALTQPIPRELRGWEYDHLIDRLLGTVHEIDRGLEGAAGTWGLAFSPDSTRFAYAWNQVELRIRDLKTGALTRTIDLKARYGATSVSSLTFSPDGKTLALGSTIRTLTNFWVMDVGTGDTTRLFPIDFGVWSSAFSPDGQLLAVGGDNPEALLFDVPTGALVRRFPGHGDLVTQMQFTPDGQHLITTTGRCCPGNINREARARVWELSSGRLVCEMTNHTDGIVALSLHPTAPLVATSGWDATLRVWNWQTKTIELGIPITGWDGSAQFSADGSVIFVSSGLLVAAYTTKGGRLVAEWRPHDAMISGMANSRDGRFLATSSFDGTIKLHDLTRQLGTARLPAHRRPIAAVAVSPDGTRLATAAWDQTVQLRAVSGLKLIASALIGRVATSLSFSPDGARLLVPGATGAALLLAGDSGRVLHEFSTGSGCSLLEAFFSPDGRNIAALGIDGYATLLAADTGTILWRRQVHTYVSDYYPARLANSIRFSPDGRRLITAGATDSQARVLDATTGNTLAALKEPNEVRCAAFAPDGQMLVTASGRPGAGTITLWNATNYTRLGLLQMPDPAGSLFFTPDGKRLVTAAGDWFDSTQPAVLRLCDLDSRRPLITLGSTNEVNYGVFVSDTGMLLGGDTSGALLAWNAPPRTDLKLDDPAATNSSGRWLSAFLSNPAPVFLGLPDLTVMTRLPEGPSLEQVVRQTIAPRGPETPADLLDLTPHATANAKTSSHLDTGDITFESNLSELPNGTCRVDGVLFDVRGFIAVGGTNAPPRVPADLLNSTVSGVAVGRKFHRLHSLLVLWPGPRDNPANQPVARFRLHFTDGSDAVLPIVEGRDALSAISGGSELRGQAAKHVFPVWGPNGHFERVCHAALENPRPDSEVRQLDLEAAGTLEGTVLATGITLENSLPVQILEQPAVQRANLGSSVEFKVAAASAQPLSYQWQRDGADVPGATNTTLRLERPTPDDVGLYRVAVSVQGSGDIVQALSEPASLELSEDFGIRGQLRLDYFDNIPDKFLTNLITSAKFPNSPDRTMAIPQFEIPRNVGDDYGARITGFILPPETGEYRFYIASDDQSRFFLSTDHQPQNKQLVAEELYWQSPRAWTAFRRRVGDPAPNVSKPIRLEKGKRYYVEALFKEGIVLDHFAVTWQLPGQPVPENGSSPIPGRYLASPDFTVKSAQILSGAK